MAVHKVEDKVEMTFWLNTGGWKRIAAGQYPMHKFVHRHHYASTYDGKEAKLYFDGKLAGVQKLIGPLSRSDVVLHISNSC